MGNDPCPVGSYRVHEPHCGTGGCDLGDPHCGATPVARERSILRGQRFGAAQSQATVFACGHLKGKPGTRVLQRIDAAPAGLSGARRRAPGRPQRNLRFERPAQRLRQGHGAPLENPFKGDTDHSRRPGSPCGPHQYAQVSFWPNLASFIGFAILSRRRAEWLRLARPKQRDGVSLRLFTFDSFVKAQAVVNPAVRSVEYAQTPSECKTKHELELPRRAAPGDAAVDRSRDAAEGGAGNIARRQTELRAVEEIERGGQELQ